MGGPSIQSAGGTPAIALAGADVYVKGDLTVEGNNIYSDGANVIEFFGLDDQNVRIEYELEVATGIIRSGTGVVDLGGGAKVTELTAFYLSDLSGNNKIDLGNGVVPTNTIILTDLQLATGVIVDTLDTPSITLANNGTGDVTMESDLLVLGGLNSNSYLTNTLSEKTATTLTTTSTATVNLVSTKRPVIKAVIYVTRGTNVQAMEVLVMRDANSAFITVYADMADSSSLVTLTADMVGSTNTMVLQATPTSASSTTFITLADTLGVELS